MRPGSVPAVEGTKVRVFGEGFGDAKPTRFAASVGSLKLDHEAGDGWSDTEILLTVGATTDQGATLAGTQPLRISLDGTAVAKKDVTVTASVSTIAHVLPSTIPLSHETVVSVVGTGFGGAASRGPLKLDRWPLDEATTWTDTLIEAKLKVDPVPSGVDTETTLRLLVSPSDRPPVVADVKVKK